MSIRRKKWKYELFARRDRGPQEVHYIGRIALKRFSKNQNAVSVDVTHRSSGLKTTLPGLPELTRFVHRMAKEEEKPQWRRGRR